MSITAWLTSVTVPESGATMPETAFTDSSSPYSAPALISAPSSGGR